MSLGAPDRTVKIDHYSSPSRSKLSNLRGWRTSTFRIITTELLINSMDTSTACISDNDTNAALSMNTGGQEAASADDALRKTTSCEIPPEHDGDRREGTSGDCDGSVDDGRNKSGRRLLRQVSPQLAERESDEPEEGQAQEAGCPGTSTCDGEDEDEDGLRRATDQQGADGCRGAMPMPRPPGTVVDMKKREKFLIFVRIMFKCLDETADQSVRVQARQIVKDCTRRNRNNDPGYESLVDAVQAKLRGIVGEVHWHRAEEYLHHYMMMRHRRAIAANAAAHRRHAQVLRASASIC